MCVCMCRHGSSAAPAGAAWWRCRWRWPFAPGGPTSAADISTNVSPSAANGGAAAGAAGAASGETKPDPPRCCATCDDVRAAYRLRGWKLPDPLTIKQCHDEGHHEEVLQQRGEGQLSCCAAARCRPF